VENSVVCVAARLYRCSLRHRVLARAGRRLAVRTGKRNYVGGGGGPMMGGSAARVGAGGIVISGLSKACLRARAWCDVAPADAVSPQKGSKALTMPHYTDLRYNKSLTVGVKKKEIIPFCHVAHELTSRTYGEKKLWVVIVKDQ